MPSAAFSLFLVFVGVAVIAGLLAAWVIGPRRPWVPALPVLAAFIALYTIGHRLGISLGPTITLFGFDVALAWDVLVALAAAALASLAQRAVVARRGAAPA